MKEWLWDADTANATHGPIEEWDVSRVTSAAHLFENALHFDADLSKWDTSSIEDFSHMFSGAATFTGSRDGSDLSQKYNLRELMKLPHVRQLQDSSVALRRGDAGWRPVGGRHSFFVAT